MYIYSGCLVLSVYVCVVLVCVRVWVLTWGLSAVRTWIMGVGCKRVWDVCVCVCLCVCVCVRISACVCGWIWSVYLCV